MIGKFTSLALRHRPLVLMALGVFIFFGITAFNELPVEAFPDVTNVSFQVITLFPGHAAEEVERLVTIPIENEMNGIPKRVDIRSVSLFGLSSVTLVFQDDAKSDYVRAQAWQHLGNVTLPPGAQATLSPDATPIGEIYRYTLQGPPGYPLVELKALEDWVVEKRFRTVPGVVDVNGFGGPTKQYQVQVDPAKLKSYTLTLAQVFNALANGNINAGGSYIEHGSELYVIRGLGSVKTIDDIAQIAVDTRGGVPVRISDIGKVVIGNMVRLGQVGKTVRNGRDDDDVVQGIVIMRKGENPIEVIPKVKKEAENINEHFLPPGVKLVAHYDRTDLVNRTLHTVRHNMIEGIGLVLAVLLVFLGLENYRSALVVALAVPVSLLGAFLLLDLSHIPANLISMGAIDFGIIVDSSVVVVENLIRILELKRDRRPSLPAAIIQAVTEMGKPVLFSKAILLTAFIPLYTLQRVEGRIFRPMALTLTFALIAGTIFGLAVVPVLATYALRGKVGGHESWIVRLLVRGYKPSLAWVLKRKVAGCLLASVILGAGALAYCFLGTEFLPKLDEGALWVRIWMPKSIAPSEAVKTVKKVRALLVGFPEVRFVVSQIGRPDDGTDVNGFDVCEMHVELKDRSEWTTARDRDGLCDIMARTLKNNIPGIESQFSQYIEDNVNEAVSGIKSELAIKLYGEDPQQLQRYADQIANIIRTVPGAKDVGVDELLGQPQIQIVVDRRAIARYGLTVNDVQQIVTTAMGGGVATQILEGERTFDAVVKFSPEAVDSVEAIRRIPVFGSSGEKINLGMVASVEIQAGLARVDREENERRIAIKMSVRDRSLAEVVGEAQSKVAAAVHLPKGYHMNWTGSFENQQRAMKRLAVIVPITIGAIFVLLYTAFNSGKVAALILLNVPFAAAGGLVALLASRLNLSVASLIGFVALFGIAIQNGVILVERIRELRRSGMELAPAVAEGAASRVRPMVMTALMAMLGLLPAALSRGAGAETARPFAVVIIGGLITGTLLTIYIIPLAYPLFERRLSDSERNSGGGWTAEIGEPVQP